MLRFALNFAARQLIIAPKFQFGLASLFKPSRYSGALRHRHKTSDSSWKKRGRSNSTSFYKVGNHNGLLRRVKIVGPRHARRLKFKSPGARHLNRNKSKANLKFFLT